MNHKAPLSVLAALLFSTVVLAQPSSEPRRTNMDNLIDRAAEEIGKEIIVDPRLPAESVGYTTDDDADYESFLALLRINGYAAVETDDQVLVIPDQMSRSNPTLILQKDDPSVSDHEIVTRIISLPQLPDRRSEAQIRAQTEANPFAGVGGEFAPQLVPVLRPMMSTAALLAAVPGTNKLIVVDRYDNVRRVTAVIEELIKDLEN
jgi:general secretion pathway protein D